MVNIAIYMCHCLYSGICFKLSKIKNLKRKDLLYWGVSRGDTRASSLCEDRGQRLPSTRQKLPRQSPTMLAPWPQTSQPPELRGNKFQLFKPQVLCGGRVGPPCRDWNRGRDRKREAIGQTKEGGCGDERAKLVRTFPPASERPLDGGLWKLRNKRRHVPRSLLLLWQIHPPLHPNATPELHYS